MSLDRKLMQITQLKTLTNPPSYGFPTVCFGAQLMKGLAAVSLTMPFHSEERATKTRRWNAPMVRQF